MPVSRRDLAETTRTGRRSLRLRLPADDTAPRVGRHSAVQFSPATGDLADRLQLLVSEVITNAIRHGELRPDDEIYLNMSFRPGVLRVEIIDRGKGFEPTIPPVPGSRSGWGLYLLDQLADRWGTERTDRTSVWFEFDQERYRKANRDAAASSAAAL